MNQLDEAKIIAGWAESAHKLMSEHGVTLLPENYAVWFDYARGSNKKLKSEIDKLISENKPFTHELNKRLYHEHVVKDVDSKLVVEASARVQTIMANVLKAVESSNSDTATYNSELSAFTDELENSDQGEFKAMVSKIVEKTNELREKGEVLNKKLENSRMEVEMLKSNLEEVSHQVSLDGLTGIANRKGFDETLLSHIRDSKENGKNLCMLMIDVDNFKKFNDTYGHLLGDQVLRIVSQCLKEAVKGKDFVARFGGEEFAVLLPDTPLRGGEIVAELIRKTIASRELKRKDTGESYGSVTVSIGVSLLRPRYDKPEDLIDRADKALYLSKKNGRNRVTAETQPA